MSATVKYKITEPGAVDSNTVVEVVTSVSSKSTSSAPGTPDDTDPLRPLPNIKPVPSCNKMMIDSLRTPPKDSSSPRDSTSSIQLPMLGRKSRVEPPKLVRTTSSFQLEKFGRAWYRFEPIPELTRGEVELIPGRWGHLLHKPYLKQYWKSDDSLVMVREPTERRSAWTELFFDLVFIVVFHHLAQDLMLAHPVDWRAVGEFTILAVSVWRIWLSLVTYIDRFRPVDSFHIAYYCIQMLIVMNLIIQSVNGVIFCYIASRAITEAMYVWASYHLPEVRRYTLFSVSAFCFSCVPWAASFFFFKNDLPTPEPGSSIGWVVDKNHIFLWALAQVIECSLYFFVPACVPSLRLPACIEHMTERHGLLVMLALGEQVMSFIFKDFEATALSYVTAVTISSLVIYTMIVYFYIEGGAVKLHAIRRSYFHEQGYIFLHIPMLIAQLMLSAAEHLAVAGTLKSGPHLLPHHTTSAERWIFCGSVAAILFCLACFGWLHVSVENTNISKRFRISLRVAWAVVMIGMGVLQDSIPVFAMYAITGGIGYVFAVVELHGSKTVREAKEIFEPDLE